MNHDNLFVRTFNMNDGKHKELTIWRCYHDDSHIQKYNLTEDEHTFLFHSKNDGYTGTNINYLNQFFCEGVCVLYPYLNNLKSDLIGFQHYRRAFNYKNGALMLDDIRAGKYQYFFSHIQMYSTLEFRIGYHCDTWRMVECGMFDDILEYIQQEYPYLLNQPPRTNDMINFTMFVSTWEKYIELAKFLYGYITFIDNKYKLDMDEYKWARHLEDKFILYHRKHNTPPQYMPWMETWGDNNWYTEPYESGNSFQYKIYRIYSFNIEFLASCWMRYHENVIDENNTAQLL